MTINGLRFLWLMVRTSADRAVKTWRISRLDAGTCGQCGHDREIDQAESLAADVPADEVLVRCSQQGHRDCDEMFVTTFDLL